VCACVCVFVCVCVCVCEVSQLNHSITAHRMKSVEQLLPTHHFPPKKLVPFILCVFIDLFMFFGANSPVLYIFNYKEIVISCSPRPRESLFSFSPAV